MRAALRAAACAGGGCAASCTAGEPVLEPAEAAACPCRVALPAQCPAVPPEVTRQIDAACARLDDPLPDPATAGGRRAFSRAARSWKRARRALAGAAHGQRVDPACADALAATAVDARTRALVARRSR